MSTFDYTASAELFALRSRSGMRYQRFAQAAEAIRRAMEKLPPKVVAGSSIEVKDQLHTENHLKRFLLVELFADPQMSRARVFARTKPGTDRVAHHLETAGIRVAAIHGNKSQSQREHALAAFRAPRIRALVATDIAARGIDIEQVTHVVNYELPDVPERYVHRIGRTARAGATGTAISLCDASERDQLHDIERLIRQSIPAEDRRSSAGRLDNRPPQPHMCVQLGRTLGARQSVVVDGHKFLARGRRQRSSLWRSHWHNDPNGGPVSFRSGRSRAGVSGRAPATWVSSTWLLVRPANWRPLERLRYGDAHGTSQIQGWPAR